MSPSTSIYSNHMGLVYAVAGPLDRIQRDGLADRQVPADFTRQRKASPIVCLLPKTQKWLDALPPGVQPHALCKFYPRIANPIAAMWTDTEALRAYFDELFVDRRRCRRGFPRDVLNDCGVALFSVRSYCAAFYPGTGARGITSVAKS
jgi:hypothetical protein